MRIATWNVKKRYSNDIAKAVDALEVDVVVLTECTRRDDVDDLPAKLRALGWNVEHQLAPPRAGVAIAAREPIADVEVVGYETAPERMLAARIGGVRVIGVYLMNVIRKKELDWPPMREHLIEVASANLEEPAVILGDLNLGDSVLDTSDPSSRLSGSDDFARLKETGFLDAFRLVHGDARRYSHFSWGPKRGTWAGWRLDHILVSPSIAPKVTACDYVEEAGGKRLVRSSGDPGGRSSPLSDHAAMYVDLEVA